jgi:2-hydroxymuconate-semialdehyde hydrolase
MSNVHSRYIDIEGIRTHYLEGGDGPTVILLHSGEFGAAAELSWEYNLPALSRHFHVVAPDWLGFGRTDKVFDFANPRGRVFGHMLAFVQRVLDERSVKQADFIGNSMGATNLLRLATDTSVHLPIRSLIAASGGGFVPLTPERQILLSYDGTPGAMQAMLGAMFHDSKWRDDEAYVMRRQAMALLPGAWSCTAAARLRPPGGEDTSTVFGKADSTPYEAISVPTLLVAGAEDRLREPGYAQQLGDRIAGCRVEVFEQCGHCPNIEQADRFNALVIDFMQDVHRHSAAEAVVPGSDQ